MVTPFINLTTVYLLSPLTHGEAYARSALPPSRALAAEIVTCSVGATARVCHPAAFLWGHASGGGGGLAEHSTKSPVGTFLDFLNSPDCGLESVVVDADDYNHSQAANADQFCKARDE